MEQIRIKIEKEADGTDITPGKTEFLQKGTRRKPKVTTGDQLTDEVYQIGLRTDVEMRPKKMLQMKRDH